MGLYDDDIKGQYNYLAVKNKRVIKCHLYKVNNYAKKIFQQKVT